MSCRGISATEMERVLRKVLGEIAVPKPSRTSEYYAALTLSIVLLKEHLEKITPDTSGRPVGIELQRLGRIRAELEEELSGDQIGGS